MDDVNKNHSRRKFLSLSLLAGAGMVAGKANAQSAITDAETVKMLTQDGKLVEVSKSLVSTSQAKKQASKRDVLGWIHRTK